MNQNKCFENEKVKKSKKGISLKIIAILLSVSSLSVSFASCETPDSSSEMEESKATESDTISEGDFSSSQSIENDPSEETSDFTENSDADNSSEDISIEDSSADIDNVGSEFSNVAWYKKENGARYVSYASKNPKFTEEQVVTYVNMGLDGAYYTNTYSAKKEDGIFILVNKYSYVGRDYEPENLVELDDSCKVSGKSVKLVKEAADAFARLSADALKLEYHIIGMSGYRTYSYQENLYNRYLKNDTKENVDTYSARPGHSEHHTGLALDVQTDTVSFSNFGQTKEYEWLLDNAHKYGFVIHYTEANQWITGYMPEEWHIRYLGVEAATYIYEHNLSVDEYLVMYGSNGPEAAG